MALEQVERVGTDTSKIGEGPHWDCDRQTLYFVDIAAAVVGRYDPNSNTFYRATVDGAKDVGFIIPVKKTNDKFVIAFDNKIVLIQWDGKSNSVTVVKELTTASEPENGRLNDGKVDFNGRLFTGTMLIDWASSKSFKGILLSYSPSENPSPVTLLKSVGLSNGLAWNKEKGKMYYSDSLKYSVTEYDYDEKTGAIGESRVVFDAKSPSYGLPEGSLPDGITIDTDGHLWIALFFGSRVIQFNVTSRLILKSIQIPTPQVTSVGWGGKNLDELYVTTCSLGPKGCLPPPAGGLFKVTGLQSKGFPCNAFHFDNV